MIDSKLYPDVDVYSEDLANGGRLLIVRGGWNSPNARQYMDDVVTLLMEGKLHNQFVEIHLDIPQVRVIIEGINELPYQKLSDFVKCDMCK